MPFSDQSSFSEFIEFQSRTSQRWYAFNDVRRNHDESYAVDSSHHSSEDEWDEVIAFLDILESDIGYQNAHISLKSLLNKLDLTPTEKHGLEPEIEHLEAMLNRLEMRSLQIAVFGMVGRGKSSLLNALLGQKIFETGPLHGVTQTINSAKWAVHKANAIQSSTQQSEEILRVSITGTGHSSIELIDTPGLDEIHGEEREQIAHQVAKQADLILFVISGDITNLEYQALKELRQLSKPIILVFNKVDQYPAADRAAIHATIKDERLRELLSPDEIVMTAAAPVSKQAIQQPDGTVTFQHRQDTPSIDVLRLKIFEVLDREGKALIALNTMLFADSVHQKMIHRKLTIRDEAANQVIWNGVITKATAIALNPIMMLDLLSGLMIDVAMVITLSRLYGISMNQKGAIQLLQHIALSMGGITASELAATLGLSSLKSLLGLSVPTTGGLSLAPYVSTAITQAGVAGVSTYGIGQIVKTYLAQGASWGTHSPKVVIKDILDSLDETYILNRIKRELQEKLKDSKSPSPLI